MSKRVGMEVSLAVSEAVKLANADVVAAYPITPQTHIVEHLSELVADGELAGAGFHHQAGRRFLNMCTFYVGYQ